MDLGYLDEVEVISSFLGPTSSLRRWGWALFISQAGLQEWETRRGPQGVLMDSGVQDEIEVISSFLGPAPPLRWWGWALFLAGRRRLEVSP